MSALNEDKVKFAMDVESSSAAPPPPKKFADEQQLEEEERIESTIDLLDSVIDCKTFFMSLCLNVLQTLTYISLLYNRSEATSNASFSSILIVLAFSALSMTSTGFENLKRLMVSGAAFFEAKEQSFFKIILFIMEVSNFCLLFITAIFIVPGQGDPLNIVLNCTALTAVSDVDQTFLKCFEFKVKKNPNMLKAKDDVINKSSYIFILLFIMGFFTIFTVLLMLYSLYSFTNTDTI
jgi:hypothetical protein